MRKYSALLLIILVSGCFFGMFTGCESNSSIATAPELEGVVNLRMEVVNKAPYGYLAAKRRVTPTTLIDDPVSDTELQGCAIIVSQVSAVDSGNEEHPIFQARYREDRAILLVDNGAGSQICNMIDRAPSHVVGANNFILMAENINWAADIPEGKYEKVTIDIEEVCITYTTSNGTVVNWHDRSFNKKVVLETGKQMTAFKISRNLTSELLLRFNISGRIGKTEGEFEPDVYLIGVE